MVGLHSPFGIIGQIKDKRGWTTHQVLWSDAWNIILLESADAPRYLSSKQEEEQQEPVFSSAEQFSSYLNNRKRK